jgi:hypothetical protein
MQADDQVAPDGADWGKPLVRFDAAWQALESRLCAAVLAAEVAALSLWVFLRGLSSDYFPGQNASGLICRSMLSTAALTTVAHLLTRRRGLAIHRAAVTAGMVVGIFSAGLWAHSGVNWSSNLLNWLQNASVFMLVGGLRGLVTRLTFWVAFLGASLATSRAKHIHIDVLLRYVPAKLRVPTAIIGWFSAAVVCLVAACGFVDYIAIAAYQAAATVPCAEANATAVCDAPVSDKLATVAKETSADFFLLGRQLSLDVRSLPRVLAGTPYEAWMSMAEWNEWLDGADWASHFDKTAVDAQKMDPTAPGAHVPAIEVPGSGGSARGLMIRELDFIFPFGLLMIALKFLLRIAILLSGNIRLDPTAEPEEDALIRANARDEEAAAGLAS